MGNALGKLYTVGDFTGTIQELGAYFGINWRTIQTRMRQGMSVEAAATTPLKMTGGTKTATVLSIGDFRGNAREAHIWFGTPLWVKAQVDSDIATMHIRKHRPPRFYSVGSYYKGTLTAISEDYDCPLSALRQALAEGKTPEEYLKEQGLYVDLKELKTLKMKMAKEKNKK